jgi:hypothetical protein
MTDPAELGDTLEAIAAVLDAIGCDWAIGGSLASAAYGEPRATNDIDVIAALDEKQAERFVRELGSGFYADASAAVAAVRQRASFNVIDQRSFLKVDVFVPAPGPMGRGQLDRRRRLPGLTPLRAVPLLAPEDVVAQKLRWYSLGGEVSDRQWRDILAVLRFSGPKMDMAYVETVATAAGLGTLLEKARREASQEP